MKKIISVILCLALLLPCLLGCAEKQPIEKAQERAVEIGEQYLDYEITAKEAMEKLDSISVPEAEGYEYGKTFLEGDISALYLLISRQDSTMAKVTWEEIKEKVDWIKNRDYTKAR